MNIFKQPFPHDSSWINRLKMAAGFGIFIAIFLMVFKPFELYKIPASLLIKSSCIFGLVTFACIFLANTLLEYFLPSLFDEKKWTTGKQIINIGSIVILIGLSNYLVAPLLFDDIALTWESALRFQLIALSVGLLPITVYTLYLKNRWLNQFKQGAIELQKMLDEKRTEHSIHSISSDAIIFEGDNQKDRFSVPANKLVYIESASNYIKVFFEEGDKQSYSIVRMTMKKATEITEPYLQYFRCHRTYLVNLDKVENIEGNAQGYKLKLHLTEKSIPVSRNLNTEFSDRLLAIQRNI